MSSYGTVTRRWRVFFAVAAVFNGVIGLAGLAGQSETTMERVVSLLVFCFGILYALMARDPLRFAPALWAGIVGKLGVVFLLGVPILTRGGDPLVGAVVAGDLLFAIGFLWFIAGPARRAPRA